MAVTCVRMYISLPSIHGCVAFAGGFFFAQCTSWSRSVPMCRRTDSGRRRTCSCPHSTSNLRCRQNWRRRCVWVEWVGSGRLSASDTEIRHTLPKLSRVCALPGGGRWGCYDNNTATYGDSVCCCTWCSCKR